MTIVVRHRFELRRRLSMIDPRTRMAASATAATNGVELSKAAQAMPGAIEAGPPFDLELVSRIKEKIA